ncbi:SDR family oxidoreductase [Metabacillus idriensis]|uniref:SDR family NAD(P)-dependent oxidoreductase n=1 Tax=Metabacillus idriensis TaxID=324768 RepID=UPI0008A982E2|nr:SDR family oxidoreductase [Metabacillus idriensis]MCM3595932.1 SDR family oxidoreductase [Metabacillus idriensis]OHR69787.1 3-ketoacyl-ACP reductase [Bacillus sp. HMSC76G11]
MKRTVIITGGANGIGEELVRQYAAAGDAVIFADIDAKKGKSIESSTENARFVQTDVKNVQEIEHLIKEAVLLTGTIDILINNAGVSEFKSPYELTLEDWDHVINTNLRSTFFCSKETAKVMRKNTAGGFIVNIASTRASMSESGTEAYAATKGGIVALTHALAVSLSEDRIKVNSISPGWIETKEYENLRQIDHDQHLSKRVGKPADIAKACFYLTDPENDFVTGTDIVVDGGMTRKMIYEH